MAESLNVIALISGGKDSFYSILHCIRNGHKVVALGNLFPPPPPPPPQSHPGPLAKCGDAAEEGEQDLNSLMYQTVGHTVIPLYETALGIPLYRQQIIGSAIQTGTSYNDSTIPAAETLAPETESRDGKQDETESLIPLLKRVMVEHPDANAVSTGAILSTYQRTRIESVALRLGLTPLSYLWQYPALQPGTHASLLRDMQVIGLDARIVKVASGGLDESFLWENAASESGIRRVERSMKRFGVDGDGGVLGEGGEFETLVIDGPRSLFKGKIEIQEVDRRVVRGGGGSAWLRILDAKVQMKTTEVDKAVCRVPDILEPRFKDLLDSLGNDSYTATLIHPTSRSSLSASSSDVDIANTKLSDLSSLTTSQDNTLFWTVTGGRTDSSYTMTEQASEIINTVRLLLHHSSLDPSSIVSTTIILRSMQDFASINSIYGALFTAPNPPSRVTISCGSLLPEDINIIIHLKLTTSPQSPSRRKALHVQSRSYWAPANIGPYSQATSIPIPSSTDTPPPLSAVSIAGQIPLLPSTMTLPPLSPNANPLENFKFQTILSLQHLFRIGAAMSVSWFTGTVAYLPSSRNTCTSAALFPCTRAMVAGQAWTSIHTRPVSHDTESEDSLDDTPRDLWEEKHHAGMTSMGARTETKMLPDWDVVEVGDGEGMEGDVPTFWAAEVEELPRGAGVEWAALSGVVGAGVKLRCKCKAGSWTVNETLFGNMIHSVVKVLYTDDVENISKSTTEALESVGRASEARATASWLDVSIGDIGRAVGPARGVVPCRSLWDARGRRLAMVLVFDLMAKD